ncbi:hypothetical protein LJK87_27325 [Paenibacillus sp. P25]|nr:hypothetical protein LJK87_27325 [Paenibacillus sp. P25]
MNKRLYITAKELSVRYGMEPAEARRFLLEEESRGKLEAAPDEAGGERWLNKQAAAGRVRRQAAALREKNRAVEPARYLNRSLQLQHAASGERLSGQEGLLEVISMLQGRFLPLSQWESQVFPPRLTDYRKDLLDTLCAEGEVVWIGRKGPGEKEGRVAFFLAESKELMRPFTAGRTVTRHAGSLELLRRKGASFLTALSRETGRAPSEVMADLLDLAWDGLVSNDQFAPLRLHGSAKAARQEQAAPAERRRFNPVSDDGTRWRVKNPRKIRLT